MFFSTHLTCLLRTAWCWLSCWLLLGAAHATTPHYPQPGTHSLAEALNPDGTLRGGSQGTFDARQFVMHLAPTGQPVFRPARTTGTGDERWRDNFQLAGADGTVNIVLPVGSAIYIGGSFTRVGNVKTIYVAKWDGTSWSSLDTGMGGTVFAMAASGTDVYVAGSARSLTSYTSVSKWNGTSWSALDAKGTNGYIRSLAVQGTTLYAGGSFTTIGGTAANYVARWDGTAWQPLGSGPANGVGGTVNALAVLGSNLYVGALF